MPRVLDLFSGAGGLSLGFREAGLGFVPVGGVEVDSDAAGTFRRNFGCPVYGGPIEGVECFEDADVVVGGPPCQGFSPLGRGRDVGGRAQMNGLWRQYVRAVRQVQPVAFVIENVPEFQRSVEFAELLELLDCDPGLKRYGYSYGVLDAADYGVPQRRRRGIMVAVRDVAEVPWPPPPTHGPCSPGSLSYRTVREAIGHLHPMPDRTDITVDADGRQDLHFRRCPTEKSRARYRAVPPGGNRFDLARNRPDLLPRCWADKLTGTADVMGRLWWDRPSVTIRAEFYKPEKGRYLHPEEHRPITHREAARIQGFPDGFWFEGTKAGVARQIGNAVPPGLAGAVARHVHSVGRARGFW